VRVEAMTSKVSGTVVVSRMWPPDGRGVMLEGAPAEADERVVVEERAAVERAAVEGA
jgi:hypothetical protein